MCRAKTGKGFNVKSLVEPIERVFKQHASLLTKEVVQSLANDCEVVAAFWHVYDTLSHMEQRGLLRHTVTPEGWRWRAFP